MTIEEKAKEYAGYNGQPLQDIATCSMDEWQKYEGFKVGAEWMIEKAIYWLQNHVNDYLFDDGTSERPWLKCKSDMFDNFKKAMED